MCRRKSKWRALSGKHQRVVTRQWREVSGLIPAIDIILSKPFWGKGLIQSHAGQNHELTNPTAGRKSFRVLNTRELEPPQGPEGRLSEWMWDFSGSAAACLRTRCKERCERPTICLCESVFPQVSACMCASRCHRRRRQWQEILSPIARTKRCWLTDRLAGWSNWRFCNQPSGWLTNWTTDLPVGYRRPARQLIGRFGQPAAGWRMTFADRQSALGIRGLVEAGVWGGGCPCGCVVNKAETTWSPT